MLRRLCFWALFSVLLLVAWRIAGVFMDLALLVVCIMVLASARRSFKRKS